MNHPLTMDVRSRAELLAFLVASHLLARRMTSEWLSVDHVVESMMLWFKANGMGTDVIQRLWLSARAVDVAKSLESVVHFDPTEESAETLFFENLHLDFRSPVAREIYRHCLVRLADSDYFWLLSRLLRRIARRHVW
jgi:hypothetical protein